MNRIYNDKFITKSNTELLERQLLQEYQIYIKENPKDTDMVLHYAIGLSTTFGSLGDIFEEIKKIFAYDPYNPFAVILYAHEQFTWEEITFDTLERLVHIQSDNAEIMSFKYIYIAYYYQQLCDDEKYEQYLLKAIETYNNYAQHYFELGHFYETQNKYDQAKQAYKKALDNISGIQLSDTRPKDFIHLRSFFDYYIKNIYPYEIVVKQIKEKYD